MPGNSRMRTFSKKTTLTIWTDKRTDGQKSLNDCSNPPPTLLRQGLISYNRQHGQNINRYISVQNKQSQSGTCYTCIGRWIYFVWHSPYYSVHYYSLFESCYITELDIKPRSGQTIFMHAYRKDILPERKPLLQCHVPLPVYYVIVIAHGQGFMAVNRHESEGIARGQGQFTSP